MNEVLAIYDFLNNYGIVRLIRIAIGIILILNKKSISILNNKNTPKRFKFALVTTYYAVILWCMLFGLDLSVNEKCYFRNNIRNCL